MIKIYEVMAVENGYPLFFIQHIKRLYGSINQYKLYTIEELIRICIALISPLLPEADGFNLKIIYNLDSDAFTIEQIQSRKPNKEAYFKGASIGIWENERKNPLIKSENILQRDESNRICKKNGLFDLLLKNSSGEITEGSRSNFLLIDKKDNIITSPLGVALNGVTREVIFDICRENEINIVEQIITEETLKSVKSLIITGTSPGILPIINCEDINFTVSNKIILLLIKEFELKKLLDNGITKEFFNLDKKTR